MSIQGGSKNDTQEQEGRTNSAPPLQPGVITGTVEITLNLPEIMRMLQPKE